MYCTHCAKKIDESKVDAKQPVFDPGLEVKEGASVSYVCPRCGHLVHGDINEEETKALSRAAHAQVQRARNSFAAGMGMISIGAIALIIAIIFYMLARKPSNQYQLVTNCAEFYVFVVVGIASVILLVAGISFAAVGFINGHSNKNLLKDINNQTFVQ